MPSENRESLFREWLRANSGTVLKVARAYTLSTEDCQDLVQEILMQVWRSLPRFQGNASVSTWSYRVALNTALSWRRKERRRLQHQQSLPEIEVPSATRSDRGGAAEPDTVERLYAAIRQLPKADAALVLLYLDNLSYRQMGEVLGISETNVGVKLNRAKKNLSELMNEKSHDV